MIILLLIILLIIIVYNKVTDAIDHAINMLEVEYDKMARHIFAQSELLTNREIAYLKHYKNFVVNPELLDPKVNIVLRRLSQNRSKKIRQAYFNQNALIEAKYPKLIDYRKSFNEKALVIYRLGMLKISNWDICIFCSMVYAYQYFISSKNHLNDLFNKILGPRYQHNHQMIESGYLMS